MSGTDFRVVRRTLFHFIRGSVENLARAEQIHALRRRTGHAQNVWTDPEFFVARSLEHQRRPWTIVMEQGGVIIGAVQLQERTWRGVHSGYYTGVDATGEQFVIAQPGFEDECLRLCLEALHQRWPNALVFLRSTRSRQTLSGGTTEELPSTVRFRIPLKASLDATLAPSGPHTRRNLRYYARQLLAGGYTFVAEMSGEQLHDATTQLRTHSLFGLSEQGLAVRERAMEKVEGHFSVGAKSPSGEWVSCLTGWRNGSRTFIFSQMNDRRYKKASLATALRGLLLEHEIQLGQSEIIFVGSANEATRRACQPDTEFILLAGRHTLKRLILLHLLVPYRLAPDHKLRVFLREMGRRRDLGILPVRETPERR